MRSQPKPREAMFVHANEHLRDEMLTNVRRNSRHLDVPTEESRHHIATAYSRILDFFNGETQPIQLYNVIYRHDQNKNTRDRAFGDQVRRHVRGLYLKSPQRVPTTVLKKDTWFMKDESDKKVGRKQIVKLAGEITVGSSTAFILESDYYRPSSSIDHQSLEDATIDNITWRQRGIAGIIVPVTTRIQKVTNSTVITNFEINSDSPLSEAQVDSALSHNSEMLSAA